MEIPVAKKSKKTAQQADRPAPTKQNPNPISQAWISMRTGIIVMSIVSLGMAVLTAYNTIPSVGVWEGILWGLIFGGSLWLVFLIAMLFHRFVRRGSGQ
jgi:sterol desaturase/sphingolipid hydroxylase (fatty acid hydroxylase superfamily)